MANQIKIGADLQSAKKSVLDFSNFMKKELKSVPKAEYLNPRDMDIYKKAAQGAFDTLKREINNAEKAMESLRGEMMSGNKTQKEMTRLSAEYVKQQENKLKKQRDFNNLLKNQQAMERQSTRMGQFGTGLSQSMGGGRAAGMLGKMGSMAGLGMLAGGAALGAGAFGVARGMNAYGTFAEGIESRQMLRGRGVADISGRNSSLQAMGLTPEEARQGMLGATGVMGSGANNDFVARQQAFALTTGTTMDQQMGLGAQLRGSVGMDQSERTLAQLQATALAAGVEGAIGPYLETAATMLTQLNEKGFTFSDDALGLLSGFTRDGETQERAASQIGNLDQAIRGASGDTAAFLTTMFAGQGVGKGNFGAIQARMQSGGLFGVDSSTLPPETRKMVENLGIGAEGGDFEKTKAGLLSSFSGLADSAGGLGTDEGRFFASKTMGDMLGFDPVTMAKFMERFEKVTSDSEKEALMKDMKAASRSPDEIMSSMDGQITASNAHLKAIQDSVGAQFGDVAVASNRLLANIDASVGYIAGFLGMGEKTIAGGGVSSNVIRDMTPNDMLAAESDVNKRLGTVNSQIKSLKSGGRHGVVNSEKMDALMREKEELEANKRFIDTEARKGTPSNYVSAESQGQAFSSDEAIKFLSEIAKNTTSKPGKFGSMMITGRNSEDSTRR